MLGSQWDMGLIYFQIYFPKQKQKKEKKKCEESFEKKKLIRKKEGGKVSIFGEKIIIKVTKHQNSSVDKNDDDNNSYSDMGIL